MAESDPKQTLEDADSTILSSRLRAFGPFSTSSPQLSPQDYSSTGSGVSGKLFNYCSVLGVWLSDFFSPPPTPPPYYPKSNLVPYGLPLHLNLYKQSVFFIFLSKAQQHLLVGGLQFLKVSPMMGWLFDAQSYLLVFYQPQTRVQAVPVQDPYFV